MSKFKVGQKVRLDTTTMPYTCKISADGKTMEIEVYGCGTSVFRVMDIRDSDGDVLIMHSELKKKYYLSPHHLLPLEETQQDKSIGYEDAIEIRKFIVSELGIDHADRFQEVYEWITGEK